jgi:hypothetical protein
METPGPSPAKFTKFTKFTSARHFSLGPTPGAERDTRARKFPKVALAMGIERPQGGANAGKAFARRRRDLMEGAEGDRAGLLISGRIDQLIAHEGSCRKMLCR